LRAPGIKQAQRAAPSTVAVRLAGHVALDVQADGRIAARFHGLALDLGTCGAAAAKRARGLRTGLRLAAFASGRGVDDEIDRLVRRLARHGLVEYRLGARSGADRVVIEPQMADYWPRTPPLKDADVLVLSRFAYLRRRGDDMVLESPRAAALFRICDGTIAAALATLAAPQPIKRLRRQAGFPGTELLALLLDCQILFKVGAAGDGLRAAEGDGNLVLWDFHDLLFHARSTEGRHANPLGGLYSYAGAMPPLPAVRPPWSGKPIDLRALSAARPEERSPAAQLLRARHSVRSFDEARPITLAELARFLDVSARVVATWDGKADFGDGGPAVGYAARPYPSAGASYELELYLAVDLCRGLERGFYHYDAGAHALTPIAARPQDLNALLTGASFAMDAPAAPQILIVIAARFGRVAWKYSALAYALILKDVGVLTQTLYLTATDIGLGGCAIGSINIELFARMTGLEFHVEGPVGQFALGRGVAEDGGRKQQTPASS
jgi:SagB-type dehydrogenase family enzyme